MKDDFLKELEYLGLIARLKRLSDGMLYSIRDLYKQKDLDIEPNWHSVFLLLKKQKRSTMTEIAASFQLSQPAIVKVINKMKVKGYIEVVTDTKDKRKRQLQLSKKALKELPKFEKIWNSGQISIKQLLEPNKTFLSQLENLEEQIKNKNFKDRVLENLIT